MDLGYWQIVISVLVGLGAPFLAAQLAVRTVSVKLDNARLDELRGVLDEAVAALAKTDRAQADLVGAVLAGVKDHLPLLEGFNELTAMLIEIHSRIELRVGSDPLAGEFNRAIMELLTIGAVVELHHDQMSQETRPEIMEARKKYWAAREGFLRRGRKLVGPSDAALRAAQSGRP